MGSVQCQAPGGSHAMIYKDWGDKDNPDIVLCIHHLKRVSDDFDFLARELAGEFRVICPDIVGRGRSEKLRFSHLYLLDQYVADLQTLLQHTGVGQVSVLGTSTGAYVGMKLASINGTPVKKLILNDSGPDFTVASLQHIYPTAGQPQGFATLNEGIRHVRDYFKACGNHTEAQWHKFGTDVLSQNVDGIWKWNYDSNITDLIKSINPFIAHMLEVSMWAHYQAITCPTLVLRGAESAFLSSETAHKMTQTGPRASLVEFAGVGHFPTLLHMNQVEPVRHFLKS